MHKPQQTSPNRPIENAKSGATAAIKNAPVEVKKDQAQEPMQSQAQGKQKPMHLYCVSLSHHSAKTKERSQYWLNDEKTDAVYSRLSQNHPESIVLSTCNRTEIYLRSETKISKEQILDLVYPGPDQGTHGSEEGFLEKDHWTYFKGKEAIRHFMDVTCSLESMIVGETQITGQVKSAVDQAIDQGFASTYFVDLLSLSLKANKEIRVGTDIGSLPVSVSHAGFDLASRVVSNLESKKVAIVGAGDMAKLCLEILAKKGSQDVTLFNRSIKSAAKLAALMPELDLAVFSLENLKQQLPNFDLIVFVTNAPQHLLAANDITYQPSLPQVVLDFCVPMNVDTSVRSCEGIFLFNLEDIQQHSKANAEARRSCLQKAYGIVGEQVQLFLKRQKEKSYSGKISDLIEQFNAPFEAFSVSIRKSIRRSQQKNANKVDLDIELGIDPGLQSEIEKDLKVLRKKLQSVLVQREKGSLSDE